MRCTILAVTAHLAASSAKAMVIAARLVDPNDGISMAAPTATILPPSQVSDVSDQVGTPNDADTVIAPPKADCGACLIDHIQDGKTYGSETGSQPVDSSSPQSVALPTPEAGTSFTPHTSGTASSVQSEPPSTGPVSIPPVPAPGAAEAGQSSPGSTDTSQGSSEDTATQSSSSESGSQAPSQQVSASSEGSSGAGLSPSVDSGSLGQGGSSVTPAPATGSDTKGSDSGAPAEVAYSKPASAASPSASINAGDRVATASASTKLNGGVSTQASSASPSRAATTGSASQPSSGAMSLSSSWAGLISFVIALLLV